MCVCVCVCRCKVPGRPLLLVPIINRIHISLYFKNVWQLELGLIRKSNMHAPLSSPGMYVLNHNGVFSNPKLI